jgi:hypothetical protein
MSDLLLIIGRDDAEAELVDEVARRRPGRVTVLVEEGQVVDLAADESEPGRALRDRLAMLLQAIEARTGAIVVGLAGSEDQLRGWRFDRVVRGHAPLAV